MHPNYDSYAEDGVSDDFLSSEDEGVVDGAAEQQQFGCRSRKGAKNIPEGWVCSWMEEGAYVVHAQGVDSVL